MQAEKTCKVQEAPILAWWLQVDTLHPICIYYFGPFETQAEAEGAKYAYIHDLKQEKAQILDVKTRFFQPRQLTIFEDDLNIHDFEDASPWLFMEFVNPAVAR
jgi:hypothetical protein